MIKYSIIVPTRNRDDLLIDALDGLIRQTINPNSYEIIIVDDGSTDSTRSVSERYRKIYTKWNIKYVYQDKLGPSIAKNNGINLSKGNIIFFTDDDCIVSALWMEKILNIFEEKKNIVGVGGWYRPSTRYIRENIFVQFHYLLHRYYFGLSLDYFSGNLPKNLLSKKEKVTLYPILTANCAYKKSILKELHGFNENFVIAAYEDMEFNDRVIAAGHSLYYTSEQVLDNRKLHFFSFLKLCYKRAKGYFVYRRLYGIKEPLLLKYNVSAVKSVYVDKYLKWKATKSNPIFSYYFPESDKVKVYRPLNKNRDYK